MSKHRKQMLDKDCRFSPPTFLFPKRIDDNLDVSNILLAGNGEGVFVCAGADENDKL